MMPRLIIITYQQDYISPNTIEASGNQTKKKISTIQIQILIIFSVH
jgi:hypothetical protein